jgi:competence protein ComEC
MTSRSLGHRAPLLWLALPMMAGLAMGKATAVGAAIPWLLGGALVVAAAAGFARRRAPGGWAPMLCAAMILAGMASYALHRSRLTAWETLPPREARLSLRIDRVFPSIDARKAAGLATIRHTDAHLRDLVGQRVYFSLALRPGTAPPLRSAEVAAVGVIETLPRDPAADTFDGYLASAGINFRFTRGRELMEEKAPTAYRRFCARTADRFSAILGAGVKTKRPELTAVLRAMLLGQQHELSDEQKTLFRQSGTMHVFSISGLHIAVIAVGLQSLLLLLRLPRVARFGVGLAALWLYVDVTGGSPSAVRAFVMVALFQATLVLRRPGNPVSALAAAALVVVLAEPLQVFSASFQMSYGIVAALLLLGLPLADRWLAAWSPFADLPKVTWTWIHHGIAMLWRGFVAAMAIGLAATLVSAISGVFFFHLFTPGALLANLVLIPSSSLVIVFGFVSLLCGLIGFTAGAVLANHAAVLLLWGIEAGIREFVTLPAMWFPAHFVAPWIGPVALTALLAVVVAGYATGWRGWSRGYWAPFAVVAAAFALGVRFGA